jgi:hypothetical protein
VERYCKDEIKPATQQKIGDFVTLVTETKDRTRLDDPFKSFLKIRITPPISKKMRIHSRNYDDVEKIQEDDTPETPDILCMVSYLLGSMW